jgi:hypothetical protein
MYRKYFGSRNAALAAALLMSAALLTSTPASASMIFTVGDVVVTVEGNGVVGAASGPYSDEQASPLSLFEYSPVGTTSASYAGSLVLPQTNSGNNFAVSGEYGSSSEGTLQLSGNGQYLTISGYGINAATFNASPGSYSLIPSNTKLGQSGSVIGQSYTPVPRVVALIDASGNVNSSTGLYNISNGNNPRSAYTANGTSIYVSGQGNAPDATGGVFYTTVGSSSATSLTSGDAGSGDSQDTREVQIYNGQLYVSTDSKAGATPRSYVGTLGTGTPTSAVGAPAQLTGFGAADGTGKLTLTAGQTNGINSAGQQINLSPENYFFANSQTLYVADSGNGKQITATSSLGDGGLQKWSLVSGNWVLDYTLSAGLNLVENPASDPSDTSGTTGLYGLTGMVINGQVELFATNETIGDLDPTFLYGITDPLSATTLPFGESFTELAAAPVDSDFKGVSFAPNSVPEPATWLLATIGAGGLWLVRRRRRSAARVVEWS